MGWGATFLTALESRRRAPRYLLEVIQIYQEPGAAWSCGSVPGLGSDTRLGVKEVSVQGATLEPRGWRTTTGAFSVALVGEISGFLSHITRGTICALKVGFDGMMLSDFQTVALGQFRNLRGRPPLWTAEFLDFYSALRQRLQRAYSVSYLFDGVGTTTTVATAYAPGATTLEVASTTGFDRETSGTGALKITPSSGDPFYLTYTGTASGPTRFTGVSAAGQMGTTAVAASVGDTVTEAAYLLGHPLDIVRKLLCSKNAGNGVYDTLPAYWGLAILDNLVDHADIADQKTRMALASGSYSWEYAVETSIEDAYSWLLSFLAPAGLFLTTRQGLLTCRAGIASATASPLLALTDEDIGAVEDYEAFDAGHSEEYHGVVVTHGSGAVSSYSTNVATLPYAVTLEYDLSDRVFSNGTVIGNEVLARLGESGKRIPERLTLQCAGLRLAQLSVGDVVTVTTRQAFCRESGSAFEERRALVVEASPQWSQGVVRLSLLVYPETEDVFA